MTATHLLVANPTAQSGKNAERIAKVRAGLARAGVGCDLVATLPDGATVDAVRAALDGAPYRVVIAMGGDGTFREVGAGLLASARHEGVAMGMLPTGTANDQGRSFGLEAGDSSLERNLAVLVAGHETRLDAGRIRALDAEGRVLGSAMFFDSAGWGISARVLAARNADRKAVASIDLLRDVYRDQLVYAGAALRVFLESYVASDKFDAIVEGDGARHELTGLTDLIVKGTRLYGGAWVFDRTARHDDGLFEVVPFHGKRDWTSKAIVGLDGNPITEAMLNAIGVEHSKAFRAASMAITFRRPKDVAHAAQIDGEEWLASDRVAIDVVPRAVRLIVPATET